MSEVSMRKRSVYYRHGHFLCILLGCTFHHRWWLHKNLIMNFHGVMQEARSCKPMGLTEKYMRHDKKLHRGEGGESFAVTVLARCCLSNHNRWAIWWVLRRQDLSMRLERTGSLPEQGRNLDWAAHIAYKQIFPRVVRNLWILGISGQTEALGGCDIMEGLSL